MNSNRFERIRNVLFAVADMTAEERDAYLEEVFAKTPEFRDEVESLLAHEDGGAPGTSDLDVTNEGASASISNDGTGTLDLVGRHIGEYEVIEELGRGGMGIVYRARTPRLGNDVALKVLPPGYTQDPARLERFAAEARLLATLNHPNIAAIHSVEQEGNLHFLTMELIEGQSLAELLADNPLSMDTALRIARQVASALEAAHARGVIHRDIKPLNVMVDADQQVKVLDFGIAKALRGEESLANRGAPPGTTAPRATARPQVTAPPRASARPSSSKAPPTPQGSGPELPTVTRTTAVRVVGGPNVGRSAIAGTPGYMSPERLLGSVASERGDIWSYGCLFYECLVGRLPFRGTTWREAIHATLEGEPLLDELPDWVPPRLRDFLERCLARDPDQRFASMRAARQEVDEILAEAESAGLISMSETTVDPGTPTNLPRRLTSFIGREREIGDVTGFLTRERLVTLTGFGGCGKTRLSIEIAETELAQFPDGVWQIELAAVGDGTLVPDAIQSTLGIDPGKTGSVTDRVIEHLRGQKALLLLDNCEHVRDGCADFISAAFRELPTLRVLATSREPIELPEERVYAVPTLSAPAEGNAADVGSSEAVRLFVDRAKNATSDFEPTDTNTASISKICRRLDGIPLALELAAARLRFVALESLAEELDHALGRLAGGSHSTLPRHQTLRSVIDWSYDQLEVVEQALLRRLSVFAADGWTRAIAEEVCAGETLPAWEVSGVIERLAEKSLVQKESLGSTERGPRRFRLLETVRAYSRERLEDSGEAEEAWRRHRDSYLAFAEALEAHLATAQQKHWLDRSEAERANVIQAINWSCGQPDGALSAMRLASAVWWPWSKRGHLALGRSVLGRVLDADAEAQPSPERARASRGLGYLAFVQGEFEESRTRLDEALRISRQAGDQVGMAKSLARIGELEKERGNFDEARRVAKESIRILRREGEKSALASALTGLGNVEDDQGRRHAALECYEESLRIRRDLRVPSLIADSLHNVASTANALGDDARALAAYRESLAIRRELGDTRGISASLNNLGVVEESSGNYERARELYEESLRLKREIGTPRGIVSSLANLGHVLERQREYELAKVYLEEAVELSRGLGRGRALEVCLGILGSVEHGRGAHGDSYRLYEEALEIRRTTGDLSTVGIALLGMGEAAQGSVTTQEPEGTSPRVWKLGALSEGWRALPSS